MRLFSKSALRRGGAGRQKIFFGPPLVFKKAVPIEGLNAKDARFAGQVRHFFSQTGAPAESVRARSYVSFLCGDYQMQIRPLHDRVIIKRLAAETTTPFGIVIPDTAGEKPDQGEVIAVGPGKRDENGRIVAPDVKVGDRVLFGKYSGQTVKVGDEELLVMREEDIMGVLE
jgi:chaperonin GroES